MTEEQRAAMQAAHDALEIAQNNLAASRDFAMRFGDGDLWDQYQAAMDGLAAEINAHQLPTQQPKVILKPVTKPLCRDCADFGPICPDTGLPCDGSGGKP